MYRGTPPIDATESTRNKQLYLLARIIKAMICPFIFVTDEREVSTASYLWHSCPMPSKGCRTPVEDSPCARKNTTGLCFDKACNEVTE